MTGRTGQLLREARADAGLTQRQLSRRSGVAPTLISAYENGRRQPAGDTLLALLDALGVRMEPTGSVPASRPAAAALEQVCAMAMALPRREPGPLCYPSFASLRPTA
jgi:transcriptional regulator with XRE-family HTH domain